jgi:hypothetical protein
MRHLLSRHTGAHAEKIPGGRNDTTVMVLEPAAKVWPRPSQAATTVLPARAPAKAPQAPRFIQATQPQPIVREPQVRPLAARPGRHTRPRVVPVAIGGTPPAAIYPAAGTGASAHRYARAMRIVDAVTGTTSPYSNPAAWPQPRGFALPGPGADD